VPDRDHAIWELAIPVPPRDWACRLKDPPPGQNSCDELETEPSTLEGTARAGGGTAVRAWDGFVTAAGVAAARDSRRFRLGDRDVASQALGDDRYSMALDVAPGTYELVAVDETGRRSRPWDLEVLDAGDDDDVTDDDDSGHEDPRD